MFTILTLITKGETCAIMLPPAWEEPPLPHLGARSQHWLMSYNSHGAAATTKRTSGTYSSFSLCQRSRKSLDPRAATHHSSSPQGCQQLALSSGSHDRTSSFASRTKLSLASREAYFPQTCTRLSQTSQVVMVRCAPFIGNPVWRARDRQAKLRAKPEHTKRQAEARSCRPKHQRS